MSETAPTVTIETVIIVRPLKVIAVLCSVVSMLMMALSIAATTWLEADGQREGLWEYCIGISEGTVNCKSSKPGQLGDWINACRALCLAALFICFVAIIVAIVGLRTRNSRYKYSLYKAATILLFISVICEVVSLIVFPAMFLQELEKRVQSRWEFGWAYGVGWGAAIFMFGAAVLLVLDRGSEEILYREKTTYSNINELEADV